MDAVRSITVIVIIVKSGTPDSLCIKNHAEIFYSTCMWFAAPLVRWQVHPLPSTRFLPETKSHSGVWSTWVDSTHGHMSACLMWPWPLTWSWPWVRAKYHQSPFCFVTCCYVTHRLHTFPPWRMDGRRVCPHTRCLQGQLSQAAGRTTGTFMTGVSWGEFMCVFLKMMWKINKWSN